MGNTGGTAGIGAMTGPSATGGTSGVSVGRLSWRSQDIVIQTGTPQAFVDAEQGGYRAVLRFSEATDATVDGGNAFGVFISGAHPEGFNNASTLWSTNGSDPYPYVAKSTVPRGMGAGETNTPAPTGVNDLQMHPPEMGSLNLVVATFVVPVAGQYTISGVGGRKLETMGGAARLKVFNAQKQLVTQLLVENTRAWFTSATTHSLGALAMGDIIYISVDRDGVAYFEAVEVAFTVTRNP